MQEGYCHFLKDWMHKMARKMFTIHIYTKPNNKYIHVGVKKMYKGKKNNKHILYIEEYPYSFRGEKTKYTYDMYHVTKILIKELDTLKKMV